MIRLSLSHSTCTVVRKLLSGTLREIAGFGAIFVMASFVMASFVMAKASLYHNLLSCNYYYCGSITFARLA